MSDAYAADAQNVAQGVRSCKDLFTPSEQGLLLELRRELHRFPELGFQEVVTSSRLEAALRAIQPNVISRVAKTGVVARVAGTERVAPLIAIRGDIDALPIAEATGLPYSSERPSVMHACGHDIHATWAVGAAMLLTRRPALGDVLIVLQPAEELSKGARAVLASGALDGVRVIYGAHVDRRIPLGSVVVQKGALAASTDNFTISFTGPGAHAARPHEAPDPVVAAAALVGALQVLVARRIDPGSPAVVTVGMLHAGTAHNVISDVASLRGTVRATDDDTRGLLLRELEHITRHIGAAHHLTVTIQIEQGSPVLENEVDAVECARTAVANVLGTQAIVPLAPANLAGEDFAWYLQQLRGCFLRIGAREAGGPMIPAHSPSFYAAEESIFVGAAVLAEAARQAAENLNQP